ncbi:MAG: sensor histidine kinase [Candidatus Rokubacteria bacterium]|nr:sensor histidine kinase [Candidatus Rokubacteria bacterium]
MEKHLGLSRATLRWLTVWGPASYLTLLALGVLYYHPHPLPPLWPAFVVLITLSAAGTFVFSRFVFVHVQRQEAEIAQRTREVSDMNEAMAVVKERQRIARELHDSAAQNLGYLHLRLAEAERQLAAGTTAELGAELADLKRVAREAYEEARQAIFGLRSMVSRSLGLIPTLTEYLHDWQRQTGVAVDLRVGSQAEMPLPPVVEVQLIGIIQEAMANVRKHAAARRVLVNVERDARFAAVSIHDEGRGFDPLEVAGEGRESFGIDTMRERAEAVGGKLVLTSRPGQGTTVEVQLPLDEDTRRRT